MSAQTISADERQPLLESHNTNAHVNVQPDPEAAVSADEPEEIPVALKKVEFWSILWYLAFVALGGFILAGIIKVFVGDGDIEVCVMISTYDYWPLTSLSH